MDFLYSTLYDMLSLSKVIPILHDIHYTTNELNNKQSYRVKYHSITISFTPEIRQCVSDREAVNSRAEKCFILEDLEVMGYFSRFGVIIVLFE